MAQSGDAAPHVMYRKAVRWAIRERWAVVSVALLALGATAYLAKRNYRLRIPSASGRRRVVGTRNARAQHRDEPKEYESRIRLA